MTIKLLLTIGLLIILFYASLQRNKVSLIFLPQLLVIFTGIILVWFPNLTNIIARSLDVGRGADLILYCWIIASLLLIFNLQFKLKKWEHNTTILVRKIALLNTQEVTTPPSFRRKPES